MKITVDLTEEEEKCAKELTCLNCGIEQRNECYKENYPIPEVVAKKIMNAIYQAKTTISDEEANKKEYNYLFSYHHSQGLGSGVITFAKEVTTYKDLKEISKYFEEKGTIKNVGILSFQLLNISEVKEAAISDEEDETRC